MNAAIDRRSESDRRTCYEHTGCTARIETLEDSDDKQWAALGKIEGRLNTILGGVCVSCILLAVDIILRRV